jgi:hypothetical protein
MNDAPPPAATVPTSPAPATPARPRPRGRWRVWLARLVLFTIVCGFCIVAMEFLVRVFLPHYNPRNQIVIHRNADGVVLGIPNLRTTQGVPKGDFLMEVAFNRHGFRDRKDFVEARPEDLFSVGDSFSIGWGVAEQERFSNLLEKSLGRPIYNVAIPEDIRGYQRTVAFVERTGAKPKHMVIGLCMENDFWDYDTTVSTHEVYRKKMHRTVLHRIAIWCKSRSALWVALSYTLQRHPSLRNLFEKAGIARNIDELTHKNELSPQILNSTRNELLKLTTNYHAVVLVIPSRALWYGSNVDKEKQLHDQFMDHLRTSGVSFIDMRPVFEKLGDPLSFYFKSDPHWNPRGHAAAAQALHEYLTTAQGWEFVRPKGSAP